MLFNCNKTFFKKYFVVPAGCKPQATRGFGVLAIGELWFGKGLGFMKPFTAAHPGKHCFEMRCPCGF